MCTFATHIREYVRECFVNKSHRVPLMINHRRFTKWLGVVREHVINWADVDPDICPIWPECCCREQLSCLNEVQVTYQWNWLAWLSLLRRLNGRDGVSNHQPHDCLLSRLFRHRSNKTSKLHVTGLCEGNSPVTAEFPTQIASDAEDAAIWWRHHGCYYSATVQSTSLCQWRKFRWNNISVCVYMISQNRSAAKSVQCMASDNDAIEKGVSWTHS